MSFAMNFARALVPLAVIATPVAAEAKPSPGIAEFQAHLDAVRTMTATTRRISQDNLHERLALDGPRDELRELGDTIDGLLARLEAAFDAQRRFVANAAHELRTPLARIRTAVDVAVAKPGAGAEVRALDGKVREGLDRADQLVEGFLALGHAEHGELQDRASVSLGEAVSAALADRAAELAEGRIAVERDLGEVTVTGSPLLLSRLIENVIDNGIRHNMPGGWLRVSAREGGRRVRVTVENGGPPLDPDQVGELARPFRRLGAERTGSARGAGLGLSIVSAIATAHAGSLTLHARPEGGLRVEVELPHDEAAR